MLINKPQVMDWIFLSEGGYAERDSEPGGAVHMGISFEVFRNWRAKRGDVEPTFSTLKGMNRSEAEEIYTALYFHPLEFDVLPSGVDYCMVDMGVNSGVGGTIRACQKALHFPITSHIDSRFLWALKTRDHSTVIDQICDQRLAVMQASHNWKRFEAGWTARLKLVRARSHSMTEDHILEPQP